MAWTQETFDEGDFELVVLTGSFGRIPCSNALLALDRLNKKPRPVQKKGWYRDLEWRGRGRAERRTGWWR